MPPDEEQFQPISYNESAPANYTFLKKTGVIKTDRQAAIVLSTLGVMFIIGSVAIIFSFIVPKTPDPHADVYSKLPQVLRDNIESQKHSNQ